MRSRRTSLLIFLQLSKFILLIHRQFVWCLWFNKIDLDKLHKERREVSVELRRIKRLTEREEKLAHNLRSQLCRDFIHSFVHFCLKLTQVRHVNRWIHCNWFWLSRSSILPFWIFHELFWIEKEWMNEVKHFNKQKDLARSRLTFQNASIFLDVLEQSETTSCNCEIA